jgi:Mitochondrial carrier protein
MVTGVCCVVHWNVFIAGFGFPCLVCHSCGDRDATRQGFAPIFIGNQAAASRNGFSDTALRDVQGAAPTMLGILPYSGLKFFTYQYLKLRWREAAALVPPATAVPAAPPVHMTLLCGGAAGLIAQTLTYPLDVVRRRMQVSCVRTPAAVLAPRTMLGHVRDIVASHGWPGLFRGLSLNYLKVVPSTAVGFTVYDNMKQLLQLENAL